MLSGIGPADELAEHGIDAVHDLKGVGKNLQDHLSAMVSYSREDRGAFHRQMRMDRLAVDMPRAYVAGSGPATDFRANHGLPQVAARSRSARHPVPVPRPADDTWPWFPVVKPAWADGFGCRPVLLRRRAGGSSDSPRRTRATRSGSTRTFSPNRPICGPSATG